MVCGGALLWVIWIDEVGVRIVRMKLRRARAVSRRGKVRMSNGKCVRENLKSSEKALLFVYSQGSTCDAVVPALMWGQNQ